LARIAIMRARRRGWLTASTPVWLIGDHPNNVEAAQANGIGSIAVATGIATEAELRLARPDLLLPDLSALHLQELFA
jgi:phosphoglycolate phosphatase-like HAD superfamily hydrolase